MKKFSMRDLVKLEFTKEEADLIMKAQRMFPEMLTKDTDGFIIDARKLWSQLGEPHGRFSKWIDRKLVSKKESDSDICIFQKDKDYEIYYLDDMDKSVHLDSQGLQGLDNKQLGQKGISVEYTLTVDCAKNVCMMENTNNGNLCRKYFILMEKAVKRISDWNIIRNPQKQGYKEMCIAIDKNYRETHDGKETNRFIYTTNADMLNLALFGYKSKTMKEILEVEYNDLLRDSLTSEANKALFELQQLNANLVYSNIDLQTRKMIIENTVKAKYVGLRTRVVSEFAKEIIKFRDVK